MDRCYIWPDPDKIGTDGRLRRQAKYSIYPFNFIYYFLSFKLFSNAIQDNDAHFTLTGKFLIL